MSLKKRFKITLKDTDRWSCSKRSRENAKTVEADTYIQRDDNYLFVVGKEQDVVLMVPRDRVLFIEEARE